MSIISSSTFNVNHINEGLLNTSALNIRFISGRDRYFENVKNQVPALCTVLEKPTNFEAIKNFFYRFPLQSDLQFLSG